MSLLDIFKSKKQRKIEEKFKKRPSEGVLNRPASEKEERGEEKKEGGGGVKAGKSDLASQVILSPQITEKTTLFNEKGVYSFRVSPRANKVMIRRAIQELYGTPPRKIRIANMPAKNRSRGRIAGLRSGYKKAMVYLKEGEKIDLA